MAEPATGAPTVRTVGRYEILSKIGHGGMAVVYLARQTDLDRFVALKELLTPELRDTNMARRFLREARLAGSLAHPNIVTVYDFFEHQGKPYIAMEYIECGSLRRFVNHMTLSQIGGVLEGILAGLAHAESRGIVHRDLKPENVMVTAEGRVKIADFGIAKATTQVRGASVLTATGMTVGTPMYMAPEQAMAHDIGPWTDLYSLGCMAFEFFTGDIPFGTDSAPMSLLLRRVNEDVPPVTTIEASVDPAISDWVGRLLVRNPRERMASAAQAWDQLEEILLRLLGPRWRRDARLLEPPPEAEPNKPLTPAPFEGRHEPISRDSLAWSATRAVDEEYETYHAPAPAKPGDRPASSDVWTSAEAVPESPPPDAVAASPPPPEAVTPPPPDDAAAHDERFETYEAPQPAQPPPREVATPLDFWRSADVPQQRSSPPVTATPEPAPVPPSLEPDLAPTMMPSRPPPEPPEPSDFSRRGRLVAVTVGIVVLVGLVAVLRLTGSNDGSQSARTTAFPGGIMAAGPLRVDLPSGWSALSAAPVVPGLTLDAAVAAAPAGKADRGALIVGIADAGGPALLSQDFLDRLGLRSRVVPDRTTVALRGGPSAYRYGELRPPGLGQAVTVYTVPTTAGVATLACLAPPQGNPGFVNACDRTARTLALAGTEPFRLGPSAAYAAAVNKVFDALNSVLTRERARMRAARTPKSQSASASRMAHAYKRSGTALERLARVSPADAPSRASLMKALAASASTHGALATAARGNHRIAYRSAAARARRAQSGVVSALAELRASGYERLLDARFRIAAVPALARVQRKTVPRTSQQQQAPQQTPQAQAPQAPTPQQQGPSQQTPERSPAPKKEPTPPPIIGGD
jgi:serine/threonine protein kinase